MRIYFFHNCSKLCLTQKSDNLIVKSLEHYSEKCIYTKKFCSLFYRICKYYERNEPKIVKFCPMTFYKTSRNNPDNRIGKHYFKNITSGSLLFLPLTVKPRICGLLYDICSSFNFESFVHLF